MASALDRGPVEQIVPERPSSGRLRTGADPPTLDPSPQSRSQCEHSGVPTQDPVLLTLPRHRDKQPGSLEVLLQGGSENRPNSWLCKDHVRPSGHTLSCHSRIPVNTDGVGN